MLIVGIAGPAGSGKDSLCSYILEAHIDSHNIGVRYAFADPVKEAASKMFNIDIKSFFDRDIKELPDPFWGISPREMAQLVGTDMARNVYDKDIWIKRAEHFIKTSTGNSNLVIIPDVRFENEAKWIREQNGLIVHIQRTQNDHKTPHANHESESGVVHTEEDFVIVNDGELEDLRIITKLFHRAEILGLPLDDIISFNSKWENIIPNDKAH